MSLGRALALVALVGLARPGQAAAERRGFLATAAPDETPWAEAARSVADRVTRQSRGKLRVRPSTGAAAGDEVETVRRCARGELLMWGGSAGALATQAPELAVFELPFLFASEAEADLVLRDGRVLDQLRRVLVPRGLVYYTGTELGWRSFAGRRPLAAPSDFAGLLARAQPSPLHLELWRALGAQPLGVAAGDTGAALQLRRVEAFDASPLYAFATSWYQHTSHFTLTRHVYQPAFVAFCPGALDELGPAERARTLEGAEEEREACNRRVRGLEAEVLEQLRQAEVRLVEVTPAERAELRRRTRRVHDLFRASTSAAGRALLARIEALLAGRRAR